MIYVLIALGNWDRKYGDTRHNFGFMLADFIASKMKKRFLKLRFGEYLAVDFGKSNKKLYIFKGKTYMNTSGITAKKFLEFIAESEGKDIVIFVAHDDVSIPFGRIKISWNGGSGGHKGVQSVIEEVGKDTVRIKLGIGSPPQKGILADYVLSPFSPEEKEKLPLILDGAFEALRTAVEDSIEKAMSLYNPTNFVEK